MLPLLAQESELATSAYQLAEAEDYPGAGRLLLRAAAKENNPQTAAQYLLDAGDAYRYGEVPDSALHAYELLYSRPAADRLIDSLRALAAHLSGLIYYQHDQPEEAVPLYRLAVDIRDRIFPEGHNDRAKSRYNLALVLMELGELEAAERALQESDRLYAALDRPDTLRWLRTLNQLAANYHSLNDPLLTRTVAVRALSMAGQFYRHDPDRRADYYYRIGTTLSDIGSTDLLISLMDSVLHLERTTGDTGGEIRALITKATAQLEKKDYPAARRDFEQTRQLLATHGDEDGFLPFVHYNLALAFLEEQNYSPAGRYGELALAGYAAWEDTVNLTGTLHLLARTASEYGERDKADDYFSQALQLLLGPEMAIAAIDPANVSAEHLLELADLLDDRAAHYTRNEQATLALADYQRSFALLDRIRLELQEEASQVYVSNHLKPLFQRAIALLYHQYQESKDPAHAWAALELSERSKAFSLLIAARQNGLERPKRQRELRRNIARLERAPGAADNPELALLRLELQRLESLSDSETGNSISFQAESLRDYLARRQLSLLEYALAEDHGYLFSVGPDGGIQFHRIAGSKELATLIAELRAAIRASAYKSVSLKAGQSDLDKDFEVAARAVFSQVLAPYSAGSRPPTRLLIVPDGVLGFLPFGALLTDKTAAPPFNYRELPYLQNGREIGYSYSAAYLLELEENGQALPANNLLAVAPVFAGESSATGPQARDGERSLPALMPLRYNREEALTVAGLFPRSATLVGAAADRQSFERACRDYRMLLISSHAVVDAEDPNQSFIAFSQRGDSLETEEMLYLNDLTAFQLATELAVLSACETSMGRVAPGEGVLSLARAFAAAGAASTLTTLWKVDDEATREYMVNFFAALEAGSSRVEALAGAQRAALASADFAHPHYWSAMTLYGRTGTVDLLPADHQWTSYGWGLAAVSMLLLAGFLLRRKRG